MFLSVSCNQSATNQQANTDSKNTAKIEIETWYACSKDTTITIGNEQIYVKMEVVDIQGEFLEREGFGDDGKIFYKVPETEIIIQISNRQYKLRKQDIPDLDSEFLQISTFYRIVFHSITENALTFEIGFGEPETCNVIFIFLTIDSEGNKSFQIVYPEWNDDESE